MLTVVTHRRTAVLRKPTHYLALQVTVQQPAAGNQSTASTTFEVGNFDIGFSLSDHDSEFDTSSGLFT